MILKGKEDKYYFHCKLMYLIPLNLILHNFCQIEQHQNLNF